MNTVREYRMPLLIGAGALVIALIVYAVLVAPQSSKLSSLKAQETQLQGQQAALATKLATLKSEKQNLTKSCADLVKIATQIPSVQSPTDVDAEESSFESQFNGLAQSSGVTLAQFSGFAPDLTAAAPAATTPAAGASGAVSSANVVAVPTTLTVTGDYAKMSSFINGLDSFPRLFVIQTFTLAFGTGAGAASGTSGSGSSSGAPTVSASGTPLWVGGTATSPTAGPYSLSIKGSIYYTSTPNALAACTKAKSSVH